MRTHHCRANPSISSQAEHLVTFWQIKGTAEDSDWSDWGHCFHARAVVGINPAIHDVMNEVIWSVFTKCAALEFGKGTQTFQQ